MKKLLVCVVAVMHLVSFSGCATRPTTISVPSIPEHYQIPPGSKVGLTAKKELPTATTDSASSQKPLSQSTDGAAVAGAVAGGALGTVGGAALGGLAGAAYGVTCGPALIFCVPLFAVVGVVGGGVAGGVAGTMGGAKAGRRSASEYYQKENEKENAERSAADVAEREFNSKILVTVSQLTSLPDRIQKISQAVEANRLIKVANDETSKNPSENAPLRQDLDFVFELNPTHVQAIKVLTDGKGGTLSDTYTFKIIETGHLVRTNGDLIVSKFERFLYTDDLVIKTWAPEETDLLAKHLDKALDTLANIFVTHWIKPALGRKELNTKPNRIQETVTPVIAPAVVRKDPEPATPTQTPLAPPHAVNPEPSPATPTPEQCVENVFPRETNPRTAEARDIIENRCRN